MSRLDINSNETYTVASNTSEEWLGADVDGSLEVNGSLELIDDPDTPTADAGGEGVIVADSPIDLPIGSLNFGAMTTGTAILFVGLISVLGGFAAVLRNYAAGVVVAAAVIALILSGTVNMGVEVFYALCIGAAVLLAAGAAVRWSAA